MNKTHQVLLLWDIGEGADLYALTVTPDEFEELRSINNLFSGGELPEYLQPTWDRVNAALSNNPEHVPDHAKACVGKWMDNKLTPGAVVSINGDWTLISSGMAP